MSAGFPVGEFEARLGRAQTLMSQQGLGALLLTTEPDVRYFTGYLTRFWESPTRPWFLVVPATRKPIAVIPAIGAALMSTTWIDDIRTWNAPDLQDDGVSQLIDTLTEIGGSVGVPDGHETHVRMPVADYHKVAEAVTLTSDNGIMRALRMVKSEAEIEKIRTACAIANRAFTRVTEIARAGVPLAQVFRQFQMLCLQEGADWVSYLAGGAGPDGYADVISPATDTPLAEGDILMLDTGLVHDGYFCDFDRNFAIGPSSELARTTHTRLIEATQAGFAAARPGVTAADIFRAMDAMLGAGDGGARLGHGLGMQLTEWPSLIPSDYTVLEPGMVVTLEPGQPTRDGRIMVHEENIVIRENGAEYLSAPASPDLPIL